MYHFFVKPEQVGDMEIVITGGDVNHIRNVLRMKPGEELRVHDGTGRGWNCRIRTIGTETVTAEILSADEAGTELSAGLYLFQGLPKSDKMEFIIQKAVELGASRIIPVETRRTVVKLDPKKAEARVRRWNMIAESAAKQSGRTIIPEVTPVMSFREALIYAGDLDVKMIPYENAEGMAEMVRAVENVRPGTTAGVLIGPEGGFEETEVEQAVEAGFAPVSLGRRILRTETAGLAVLSVLMYRLEADAEGLFRPELKELQE